MGSIHHSPLTTAASPSMFVDEVEEDLNEVVARLESLDLYEDDDADVHALIDSIPLMFLEAGEDDTSVVADVEESVAGDVFKKLLSMEMKKAPIANYMESVQTQIDSKSRALCVDLLVEAAEILHCTAAALHLAVKNLDRYLSGNSVDMTNLLTVAMTCLKMAGSGPGLDAYAYLCEDKISGGEFVGMEARILSYLNRDVAAGTVPTAYSFLKRFVSAAQRGRHAPLRGLDCVAAYVAEVSLLTTAMLRFSPSMVAASSVFLAQYILDPCDEKPWNPTLRHYTTYEASDLQDCVLALHGFLGCDDSSLPAITAKYCREEKGIAALKIIPPAIPLHTFEDVYNSKFGW